MAEKTIVIRIVARANQAVRDINQVGAAASNLGVEVSRGAERAVSSTKALGAASAIAGKMMVVGIGGALAVSAKAAIDFESSLAGVAKTVEFANSRFENASSPINAFGESLRALSKRIPVNVNELARIAEMGGQLGVEADNLIEFTETMAALGVSTNMSAEEAATGLARLANIMGTSQDDFDVLGSILVELGNNLATTEAEILTFSLRIASAGQVIGATEADIMAIAGAMSSLGVPAERGGTAVQRVFIDMANAVEAGGAKLGEFSRVAGMTVDEFGALFRDDPARAFEAFVRGLDRVSDSGENVFQVLDRLNLNQVRTSQVLLAAAGGADILSDALNMANEEAEENTALATEAGRRYATTASQIQLTANAFNDLRIQVGNMVMGTGVGIAALDWASEFFRILGDNIEVIQLLGVAMLGVMGLKFGHMMLLAAADVMKKVAAVKTATTALNGMKLAAAGVNIAMLGVAGLVVSVVAAMAGAAVNAARMRDAARQFTAEIEAGKTAAESLTSMLGQGAKSGGIFGTGVGSFEIMNEDAIDAVHELAGMSWDQFVEGLMEGRDILSEVTNGLGLTGEGISHILAEAGRLGEAGAYNEVFEEVEALEAAQRRILELIDGIRQARMTELVNSFYEAGLGAGYTKDRLYEIAEIILNVLGLGVDPDSALAWLLGDPDRHTRHKPGQAFADIATAAEKHWTQIVAETEEGADALEQHFSNITDIADNYVTEMDEAMMEVKDIILGSFPTWDEYEQVVALNLAKVLESQRLFVQDMAQWASVQESLTGVASAATMEWLDNLDPATKGALARLAREDEAEFFAFIRDVNANWASVAQSAETVWMSRLPSAMRSAMAAALVELGASAEDVAAFGVDQMTVLVDAMNMFLSQGGFDDPLEKLLFENKDARTAMFAAMGMEFGGALMAGILAGMGNDAGLGRDAFGDSVTRINDEIKDKLNKDWEVSSPSKWMMRFFGRDVMGGAVMGVESRIPDLERALSNLPQNSLQPSPSISNVTNGAVDRSQHLHIIHPQSKDLKADLRYGTALMGAAAEFGG